MTILDRVVADSTDRDSWMRYRHDRIGASDAAKFAKATSVESYIAEKLAPREFHGNTFTESGNRWEPMLCAFAGIPNSTLMIEHPDESGFIATPDGLLETERGLVMAECKTKHNKIVTGPDAREWRQLAWQFFVIPESVEIRFIWGMIVDDELRGGEPSVLTITRDNPKIVAATELIVPIATRVLASIRAAREIEKELEIVY